MTHIHKDVFTPTKLTHTHTPYMSVTTQQNTYWYRQNWPIPTHHTCLSRHSKRRIHTDKTDPYPHTTDVCHDTAKDIFIPTKLTHTHTPYMSVTTQQKTCSHRQNWPIPTHHTCLSQHSKRRIHTDKTDPYPHTIHVCHTQHNKRLIHTDKTDPYPHTIHVCHNTAKYVFIPTKLTHTRTPYMSVTTQQKTYSHRQNWPIPTPYMSVTTQQKTYSHRQNWPIPTHIHVCHDAAKHTYSHRQIWPMPSPHRYPYAKV